MSSKLHILNGDSTFYSFKHSGLGGETLVWREVFSEGPLKKDIDTDFWKMRAEWIAATFNDTTEHYMEHVEGELGKLNGNYSEINLWFEFDLHCQANLLGVMTLLGRMIDLDEPVISLICPDSYPGVDDFRGMGQLDGGQLADLYESRIQLSEYDFRLAAEAWEVYVQKNEAVLSTFINENPFWGSLHLLKPALEAELKRLQVNAEGLNYIEQKLKAIHDSGVTNRVNIYEKFWADEKIYGMGDTQLDIYLKKLGLV